jgi:hypothetical protein
MMQHREPAHIVPKHIEIVSISLGRDRQGVAGADLRSLALIDFNL